MLISDCLSFVLELFSAAIVICFYATTTGSAVTGSDYSAKEWALGDLTATGGSAKAWAVDTSSPDGTTTKSAKTWAGEAATSAASADSVSTSNAIVMGIALG